MFGEVSEAFYKINPLLDEQRLSAYDSARRRIAGIEPTQGDAPQLANYYANAFRKYSPATEATIMRVTNIVMFAAFTPSALRIFIAGFEASVHAIPAFEAAIVIGLMSVILAESGQIAFTLAASVTQGRVLRASLWIAAAICTLLALVGNAHVVRPWHNGSAFAWLETFAPPILVLIAANVRKAQVLNANAERFDAQQKYTDALKLWQSDYDTQRRAWETAFASAHLDAAWDRTLANVLRDELRKANRQSKAVLRELTTQDWRALVLRERAAEEWWDAAEAAAQAAVAQERNASGRSGTTNGNATGEIANVPTQQVGDMFVKECPVCGERFEGKTRRSAVNALVAHHKKHANEERKLQANGTGG